MNASPYSTPISAPKCLARASIIPRNFGSEMKITGSFDFAFGSWNCDLNAAIAFIFVFHAAVTSTTNVGCST